MTWVGTRKESPTDISIKYLETLKLDHDLIEFSSKGGEELKKTAMKTKNAYAEFYRRFLLTYNRCQTSAAKRLEVLPEHEMFLKQLQERCNEDEHAIQQFKELDEKILKTEIAHAAVSIHLLEDQLRLISARIAGVKAQAAQHEIFLKQLQERCNGDEQAIQ